MISTKKKRFSRPSIRFHCQKSPIFVLCCESKSKDMELTRPTLLIDPLKSKENLKRMKKKADHHKVAFRPHFKTHQSHAIGSWFKKQGVKSITVSSADMAEYFMQDNWNDILIAFPLNINELNSINRLSGKINLSLTLENQEGLAYLNEHLRNKVDVYIKIDTGYNRTGIPWENKEEIVALAKLIHHSPKINLKGILCHAGQTYQANTVSEIRGIHQVSRDRMVGVKKSLKEIRRDLIVSIGDTPGCSLSDDFTGIDEVRPGNFIFYDLQQYKLGACQLSDIAVCMACPVVAKHQERNELVVYGGAVHFSKDSFMEGGKPVYGYVVPLSDEDWVAEPGSMVMTRMSQEHGIISVTPDVFHKFNIGEFIGILPSHSCLTANLMKGYYDFQGHHYDHMQG